MHDFHLEHMQHALSIAKEARYLASPNPMVGSVLVKDGKIIGTGFTHEPGKDHAEINAIKNVQKNLKNKARDELRNSCLYTTLEPCSKKGKTPACTKAIIEAGIKEVFIATKDPLQEGIKDLKGAGIKVNTGLCEDISMEQNRGFFSRISRKRPFITCKIACSLDGGIGLTNGDSKWITSQESRLDAHKLRASSDAILTGIGTVLADNPKMTVRSQTSDYQGKDVNPKRYVLDSQLRLKGDEHLVTDGTKTTIFCNQVKKVSYLNPTLTIIEAPGESNQVSLKKVMRYLNNEKCNNLMVEAGSTLITGLIVTKLIDEFVFYIAPKILGKNKINFTDFKSSFSNLGTIQLKLKQINEIGPDIKVIAVPTYQ